MFDKAKAAKEAKLEKKRIADAEAAAKAEAERAEKEKQAIEAKQVADEAERKVKIN
jgi:hypothetical protein